MHAVCGGTLSDVTATGFVLVSHHGHRWQYAGSVSCSVDAGRVVESGAIVGHVQAATHGHPRVRLRAIDAGGRQLSPYRLLLGAPDPNELGYRDVGMGVGIDPTLVGRPPATLTAAAASSTVAATEGGLTQSGDAGIREEPATPVPERDTEEAGHTGPDAELARRREAAAKLLARLPRRDDS